MGIRVLSICAVETMLWITGIGAPSSSGASAEGVGGHGASVHGSSAGTSAV